MRTPLPSSPCGPWRHAKPGKSRGGVWWVQAEAIWREVNDAEDTCIEIGNNSFGWESDARVIDEIGKYQEKKRQKREKERKD